MTKRSAGFTMIELVVVMILIGIMAAVAIPRMTGAGDFRARAFRDSVSSALRYAQKTATSHRRVVCAAFTVNSVTLTIATVAGGACGTALPLADGKPSVTSPDPANVNFGVAPGGLSFQPDGTIRWTANGAFASGSLSMGGLTVPIEGTTGYVK